MKLSTYKKLVNDVTTGTPFFTKVEFDDLREGDIIKHDITRNRNDVCNSNVHHLVTSNPRPGTGSRVNKVINVELIYNGQLGALPAPPVRKSMFLISPVRKITPSVEAHIKYLMLIIKQIGYDVYFPKEDTQQTGVSEFKICSDNLEAIKKADVVGIYFDPTSQATPFDLGLSFALGKKLFVINHVSRTEEKSFANMIMDWQERQEL